MLNMKEPKVITLGQDDCCMWEVRVEMRAFHKVKCDDCERGDRSCKTHSHPCERAWDGTVRVVKLPKPLGDYEYINYGLDVAELLDDVFMYGQNDFQPDSRCCSVSVDDVIVVLGRRFVVKPVGFEEI